MDAQRVEQRGGSGGSFGARAATVWCSQCVLCFDPTFGFSVLVSPKLRESPGGVCSSCTELLRGSCATFPLKNQECLVWEEPHGGGLGAKLGFVATPESSQGTPGRG